MPSVASSSSSTHSVSAANKPLLFACVGRTGSGKSSFIRALTSATPAENEVTFCASRIEEVTVSLDGRLVTLIDMPGYDDANANDAGTLRLLANHLELAHKNKQKLAGILQFHRITAYHSKRIPPVDSEMLHMFASLCESGTCRSVALCTTMWDRVAVEAGEQREQELCARFWQPMIERGAKAYRHNNTHESAAKILQLLAYSAQRPATPPRSPSPRKMRRISFRAQPASEEPEERLRHEARVVEPHHDLKALLDSIAAELVRLKRAQEEQRCLLAERDAQIADLRQQLVRRDSATTAH